MNVRTLAILPLFVAGLAIAEEPAKPATTAPSTTAPAQTPAPAPAKPTFKEVDTSGNGAIEKAEAEKHSTLATSFATLDADKSGALSETEFAAWK